MHVALTRLLVLVAAAALAAACGGQSGAPSAAAGATPEPTAVGTAAAADSGDPDPTAGTHPVTVENCSIELTFEQPPERAVAIQHNTTEMMLALGLEDRMVGTAYVDGEILPEFQDAYEQVPSLGDQIPSQEALLGAEPDFVFAGFGSILSETGVGTREELAELGIPSALVSTACVDGDPSLDDVYSDLRMLGEIFGVSNRAEQVIAEMQATAAEVAAAVDGVDERPRVLLYDSDDDPPFVFGGRSLPNTLVEQAGGENIFAEDTEGYVEVNWEQVVARDPQVIVVTDAVYSPAADKIETLSQPPLADMSAVADDRYVTVLTSETAVSIRGPEVLRRLAEALHPEAFSG